MTNGISEQLSLLASLVAKESRESTANNLGTKTNDIFAGKLDLILANDTQVSQTNLTRSQSLAEALNLQMLHTSLSLAGEATTESPASPLFNRQSATIPGQIQAAAGEGIPKLRQGQDEERRHGQRQITSPLEEIFPGGLEFFL